MAHRLCDAKSTLAHQPAEPQVYAYSLSTILFALFLLALPIGLPAQKKAGRSSRQLAKAEQLFAKQNFSEAIRILKPLLEKNPGNGHAWMLLGEASLELNDTALAFNAFRNALKLDSLHYGRAWAMVGQLALDNGRFEEAVAAFHKALSSSLFRENERKLLSDKLEISELRLTLSKKPHPVRLINPGPPLNTPDDELPNSILLDGSLMLFTRKEARSSREGKSAAESFFVSRYEHEGWSVPGSFVPWQEGSYNMGAPAFSPDGSMLWFAGCGWPDGFGSCDLYFTQRTNGRWQPPVNAGPVINSAAWESQPAVSSDGQTLIFASNRPGGYGGSDLYRSVKLPGGQWSRPENLGPVINTSGNEMAPFFHPDGNTLYFSSDGHPGMGGYDLFLARLDLAGRWSKPVNLGLPVNSAEDELNIVVDASGLNAMLGARRKDGFGGYDIYFFEVPETLKPNPLRIVKLLVSDAETHKPIAATVGVSSLTDGSLIFEGTCRADDGLLLFPLPKASRFSLFAGSEGYFYFSENYDFSHDTLSLILDLEIKLKPAIAGNTLIARNINFDFNSAVLLPEAYPALRHLLSFLNQNPGLRIEIGGHTDNVGTPAFNQRLSLQRAESVRKWLVDNGVQEWRILVRGYGSAVPVASNDNEAGRAQNRRTEIKVLGPK